MARGPVDRTACRLATPAAVAGVPLTVHTGPAPARATVRIAPQPDARPETVLFLAADTGGGHRAATEAIGHALDGRFPGRFTTVVCDPLTGPEAHRLLRRVCRWYGPVTRTAPWLWSVAFHATDTPVTRWVLRRLPTRWAVPPIATALERLRPAVVVVAHPLAVAVCWGSPYGQFRRSPLRPIEPSALRTALGLRTDRFVVLGTAGAEGGNDLRSWIRTIIARIPDPGSRRRRRLRPQRSAARRTGGPEVDG
jgi:hypothetical protein